MDNTNYRGWSLTGNLKSVEVDGKRYMEFSQLQFQKKEENSDAMAATCFVDRSIVVNSLSDNTNSLHPNLTEVQSNCGVLALDVNKALASQQVYSQLLPAVLWSAKSAPDYMYNGWGRLLVEVAVETEKSQKNLNKILDPQGDTPVIQAVIANVEAVSGLMPQFSDLTSVDADILNMVGYWGLYDEQSMMENIDFVLTALNNSINLFHKSTMSLIYGLSSSPSSKMGNLNFAFNIESSYKQKALRAKGLAEELGFETWVDDNFDRVLQEMFSEGHFDSWIDKMQTVKTDLLKYPKIKQHHGSLAEASIRWLDQGIIDKGQLNGIFSSIDNISERLPVATKLLVNRYKSSYQDVAEDLKFAGSLTVEYQDKLVNAKSIAAELGQKTFANRLIDNLFKEKYDISLVRAWNGILVAGKAFSAREVKRSADSFGATNKRYVSKIIDTSLKEVWKPAYIDDLEKIAELGLYNTFWDHHKGYATVADAIGMGLFSTKEGEYFDPNYGRRYGQLAAQFIGHMKQLSSDDHSSLRRDLINGYFGNFGKKIWRSCDMGMFQQNANELKSLINKYLKTTDTFDRWDLERAIKDKLEDCE